jgi:osmoprotectant transport system permease protein
VAGCVAAAALALVADGLLTLVERGLALRRRGLVWLGLVLTAVGIAGAAWSSGREEPASVVVGAKNFSEQYILARLIGQRLEAAGYRVVYRDGLGSGVMQSALSSGSIDVAVDYTGTLWTNELNRQDSVGRDAMLGEIGRWEQAHGPVRVLGRLGFENAYAFAMRSDRAAALGVRDLNDLARVSSRLTVGGDIEFFDRPEWRAVSQAYGFAFARQRSFAPTFMYDALRSGEADVITAFTSDGRIAADKLTVIADPRHALPNYDAIVLIGPNHAEDGNFVTALTPLVGRIPVETMREANLRVDRAEDKQSPAQAAEWLNKRIAR